MRIKFKGLLFIAVFFIGTYLYSQTAGNTELSRGEQLFKENNAKDAVQVLEYEILNGQISDNSYNFLGLGYYQLGEYEKSIDAFKRGLKKQPDNSKILSYNMGNSYYALKDFTSAAGCYSDTLKADPLFYNALLNRANSLLMAEQLVSAKEDYIDFVNKAPDDPQRERIELLIKALEEEIARREEEARLLAEQNKAQWEEYDGALKEQNKENFTPDWEMIEKEPFTVKNAAEGPEWEKINGESPETFTDNSKNEKVTEEDDKSYASEYWEEFETDGSSSLAINEEVVSDEEVWLTFSDEELEEMKELEKESREEHERWLEDERRRAQEIATKNAKSKQRAQEQTLEEERRLREQLIEDMRKSDEERRKKLLEDVANSLQNTDSTNLTSGAEDLIDYDLEGELD